MQYEQAQLQPTEICTQAWCSRSRFIGRWPVKPSNSKKPCAEAVAREELSQLVHLAGPERHVHERNISNTRSFIDCDQQPPIPITRPGCSAFSRLSSPR